MDYDTNLYEIDQYDQVSKYNPKASLLQELFIMKIDVGQGNLQSLPVHDGSDPRFLAMNFCQTYNLVDDAMPVLEDNIRQNMEYFYKQQKSSFTVQNNLGDYSVVSGKQNTTIFNRLHQEAYDKKLRQQIQQAREFNKNIPQKKTSSNNNSGQKLYQKGMLQKDSLKKKVEREQTRKMKDELENSFRPYVSDRSSKMTDSRRQNECCHDHLIMQGKILEERKIIARNEKLNSDLSECSFKPVINQISEKIVEEKLRYNQNLTDTHEKLYQESFKLQAKRTQIEQIQQYEHKPRNLSNSRVDAQQIPFLERMAISVEEKQAKQLIQSREESLNDPLTGQEFFKPIICRPPMIDRNIDSLPIGEYLYQMRNSKEQKQNQLIIEQTQTLQNSRTKIIKKSNDIYDNLKRKALEEIFNMMDSDQDGSISAHSVEITEFNSDVLQILAPLLCEMEQIKAELNQQQFIDSANRLLQSLTIGDRDKLLSCFKKKILVDHSLFTFHPQLNKKSLLIAPRSNSVDKIKQNQKISLLKLQQDQQELRECTFKPTLYKPFKCYDFSSDKLSKESYSIY